MKDKVISCIFNLPFSNQRLPELYRHVCTCFWTPDLLPLLISQSVSVSSLFTMAPHAASWDLSLPAASKSISAALNSIIPYFLTTLSPCLSVLLFLPHQSSSTLLFCSFLSHLCICYCLSQLLEGKCYIWEFPLILFYPPHLSIKISVAAFHSIFSLTTLISHYPPSLLCYSFSLSPYLPL